VKILLWQREVNPDQPNNSGLTPPSGASRNGYGVVKILLGREDVNPGRPDCVGITPFMFAARHGHDRVTTPLQYHEAEPQDHLTLTRHHLFAIAAIASILEYVNHGSYP